MCTKVHFCAFFGTDWEFFNEQTRPIILQRGAFFKNYPSISETCPYPSPDFFSMIFLSIFKTSKSPRKRGRKFENLARRVHKLTPKNPEGRASWRVQNLHFSRYLVVFGWQRKNALIRPSKARCLAAKWVSKTWFLDFFRVFCSFLAGCPSPKAFFLKIGKSQKMAFLALFANRVRCAWLKIFGQKRSLFSSTRRGWLPEMGLPVYGEKIDYSFFDHFFELFLGAPSSAFCWGRIFQK